MCDTCGCGSSEEVTIKRPGELHAAQPHEHSHERNDHNHTYDQDHSHTHGPDGHVHSHGHDGHSHSHSHDHGRTVELELDIMSQNNLQAQRNRGWFEAKNILTMNLVSSPGSGKTSLLEKTLADLKNEFSFYVVEGDQQTMNDADRINALNVPVVQVNTGNGCHLDADMIYKAKDKLSVEENGILVIENVGNLVCPSLFDLGEGKRVVIISVTEGEDKPIKYPTMFESSDICIINKIDLLPYVDFDVQKCREYALRVNDELQFFELSVRSGEGMNAWYDWLRNEK